MNTKAYVDNLAVTTTENELRDLFSNYGNVVSVNITVDRTSHEPRGFGFVTMVTPEGARSAIKALNGKTMGTNTLRVSEGWVNEDRTRTQNKTRTPRRRSSQMY
jgi:RNA recognition motif-containing protein